MLLGYLEFAEVLKGNLAPESAVWTPRNETCNLFIMALLSQSLSECEQSSRGLQAFGEDRH